MRAGEFYLLPFAATFACCLLLPGAVQRWYRSGIHGGLSSASRPGGRGGSVFIINVHGVHVSVGVSMNIYGVHGGHAGGHGLCAPATARCRPPPCRCCPLPLPLPVVVVVVVLFTFIIVTCHSIDDTMLLDGIDS